ncbi:MAG TPA: class I SAM-dependent methyltransferase [Terriglobia bacterium]|nr:class I SAM-dependent methyltransferase [Terriglobia bacterium]
MGHPTLQPSTPKPESYDEVLYPGFSFVQSHPDRLAAQALLFGMTPTPLESSRILEIGCGDGANLIPIAFGLPGSQCVGIDLAMRPIALGQKMIETMGLKNVTLRKMDIMEVTKDLGEFDYILAHGVYSWVPPAVQDELLAICAQNLAPNGVAYVSYNAYPGGHIRQMIRRMMLYHTRNIVDPLERVSNGLGLIQGLLESMKEPAPDPILPIIKPEFERMRNINPQSLFHDDFAEFNEPVYFYEFMERATRHGLKYLAEADLAAMHVTHASVLEGGAVDETEDVIECEQLLDFRVFRNFRATLLCHKDVRTVRVPPLENVRRLYIAADVVPDSTGRDSQSDKGVTFRKVGPKLNLKVTTDHPLTKAALFHLSACWPERISFEELKSVAFAKSGWTPTPEEVAPLEAMLLKMHVTKILDLHAHKTQAVATVSDRPVASALARTMLRERGFAASLNHNNLHLDGALSALIQLLDGTRNRADLINEMETLAASGNMTVDVDGAPAKDAAEARKAMVEGLEENLQKVARMALLVA